MKESEPVGGEESGHGLVGENGVNAIGHRYRCSTCGSEAIVTKAGKSRLGCHGQMEDLTAAETGDAAPR